MKFKIYRGWGSPSIPLSADTVDPPEPPDMAPRTVQGAACEKGRGEENPRGCEAMTTAVFSLLEPPRTTRSLGHMGRLVGTEVPGLPLSPLAGSVGANSS